MIYKNQIPRKFVCPNILGLQEVIGLWSFIVFFYHIVTKGLTLAMTGNFNGLTLTNSLLNLIYESLKVKITIGKGFVHYRLQF